MQATIDDDDPNTPNMTYMGALVVDIARLAALNDDLTCNIHHPRNAIYRVPLSDPNDEDMAIAMADAISAEDPEIFEQALIDARRMVVEPAYARLFGAFAPQSLDEIVRGRIRE